jgi:hypothetical protein
VNIPSQENLLTQNQLCELLEYVPSWHACALGPVPFGEEERVRISVSYIICDDWADALHALEYRIHEACERWNHPFDEDEWEVMHIEPMNCN